MDSTAMPAQKPGGGVTLLGWIVVILSFAWSIVGIPFTGRVSPVPLFLLAIPFALMHGSRRYGWAGLSVYFISAWVISNILENSSVFTGFPFGNYHYTFGPKLIEVPIMIGPFYIAIGYLSWLTANSLLGEIDNRLQGLGVIVLPVVAGAVMTMFDLVTDPTVSTLGQGWIWEEGGGFYGVPLTNFLGWWLVTYLFFQVFALYLRSRAAPFGPTQTKADHLQAILLYFNLSVMVLADFIIGGSGKGTVVDRAGTTWIAENLQEGMLTVFPFTVLFVTLLAIVRLYHLDGSTKQ